MARIRHIAIATQDADKTAKFFKDVFGLKELRTTERDSHYGHILTDGYLNLAILDFKTDGAAGSEFGVGFSGLHHIGIHVEDIAETSQKLIAADKAPRDDINEALGMKAEGGHEFKWSGPDGILFDISERGWDTGGD